MNSDDVGSSAGTRKGWICRPALAICLLAAILFLGAGCVIDLDKNGSGGGADDDSETSAMAAFKSDCGFFYGDAGAHCPSADSYSTGQETCNYYNCVLCGSYSGLIDSCLQESGEGCGCLETHVDCLMKMNCAGDYDAANQSYYLCQETFNACNME